MTRRQRQDDVYDTRAKRLIGTLDVMMEAGETHETTETPNGAKQAESQGPARSANRSETSDPRPPTQEREGAVLLSDDAKRVLVEVANKPDQFKTAVSRRLGLSPRKATRAFLELERVNFVRAHRLVRSGPGGQPQILEVLAEGAKFLVSCGLPEPMTFSGKGKFVHRFYAHAVTREPRRQGLRPKIECTVGDKCFDAGWRDEDGTFIGVEIILSGSLSWNEQQMKKALRVRGLSELIIASDSRQFLQKLKARLQAAIESSSPTVTFLFLGDVVTAAAEHEEQEREEEAEGAGADGGGGNGEGNGEGES